MKYDWKFKLGCVLKYKEGRRDFAPVSRIKEIKKQPLFCWPLPIPIEFGAFGCLFSLFPFIPIRFWGSPTYPGACLFLESPSFPGAVFAEDEEYPLPEALEVG